RTQNLRSFSSILNSMSERQRGVEVAAIVEDQSDFKKIFNPNHPDADKDGYVHMPNVEVVNEMINLISASRAYEANITAINTAKQMAMKAAGIGR
ncbi:MAG: flagellar basal body rod protein FlgC, partial [Bacillota bacterium]|nr:flagellar basal body rod protein FlgC [Bacillota bacterium]